MPQFADRRESLRRLLSANSLAALLVTDELNVKYLSGFTGDSSYLLISQEGELLLSDRRYEQQIEEECPGLEVAIRGPAQKTPDFAAETIAKFGLSSLAIEADAMTVSFYEKLKEAAKGTSLASSRGVVESLRSIKDDGEITAIREAVQIAERAFNIIRASLRPDRTEKDVADELEYRIRLQGGQCGAFPSIVGVGPRAALPHGRPTAGSRIADYGFVLIDWGARESHAGGYHSDLTRVLVTGKLSPQLEKVYGVVLAAQTAAIAAIRPGAVPQDIDRVARKVIEDADLGKSFGHALGHGIGLAIHEQPRLAPGEAKSLVAGMVVTVEPGVYLPGWGGVRIEDDVLVTADGRQVLTSVPKNLEQCLVG
jgi:Xaa-Pro aminopeptidase